MENLTGKTLGQYQITNPLGEGGMAAVYKAYQPGIDRYVALKILPRHFAQDPKFVKRFEQEARIVAKLQHPHILPIHDYGEQEGYTYIVMPYVQTGTLADYLEGIPLPLDQLRSIMRQLGDALDYAHGQGVIHRDIKPSNVLVDERSNCMLTDFGIGKILTGATQLTQTGDVFGTPAYMSPEQGLGKTLDGRSDIYSLGVILYEMVTGRRPYHAETPMAVIIKHVNDPLPLPRRVNPNLPEPVQAVVLKALAKDPAYRFGTAGEMVAALDRAVKAAKTDSVIPTIQASPGVVPQMPELESAPIPSYPKSQPGKRRNLGWVLAGIGAIVVIGTMILLGVILFGNRFWGRSVAVVEPTRTQIFSPTYTAPPTEGPDPQPILTDTVLPLVTEEIDNLVQVSVFDEQGLTIIQSALLWGDNPAVVDVNQAEILSCPKEEFDRVARLSVRGYGHGDQTAWITVRLDVPESADIVLIPVATALNGNVNDTDSESALEIRMYDPESGRESWTYASYLYETNLSVPYVYAFADASPFRGQTVDLMISLRQLDVCAGTQCTHDADFYIGDLSYGDLPELCTTRPDGTLLLYDYYDDPTPSEVSSCQQLLSYSFIDVEDGPYNHYGVGKSEYELPFKLPENAQLIDFRLYYGYHTEGMIVNDQFITPEEVYEAFPQRVGVYHNIPEPSRYLLFNRNPEFMAPLFAAGENVFIIKLYTENVWEERPFDVFMRFMLPAP